VYLRAVLHKAGRRVWSPVRAVIGVPVGSSALEHRALLEAAEEAGIRPVVAIDESVAGAVGCGIDPLERRVHMVVDVGGGTAEAVAFCFGGVLAHRTSKLGGDEMTIAVARYLREQHQLHVGELEAENLKIRSGSDGDGPLVVQGRDAATGRPRLATVQAGEVADAVRSIVEEIVRTLAACLDDLPPQAIADVLAEGVLVFGGSSLVHEFPQELERSLGLPVKLAEEPLTCVAEGAARALRSRRLLAAYGRS
jgi:rod shape-determining protein MreB